MSIREQPVHIDSDALGVAISHVRLWKERALDNEDYDKAAGLRDEEKRLLGVLASGEISW